MTTKWLVFACVLVGCGDKAKPTTTTPPGNTTAKPATGGCAGAVDKLFAFAARQGNTIPPEQREPLIAECNKKPDDPMIGCINSAATDEAIDACFRPPKKHGEPHEQLDIAVDALRTYYFVNETFTDENVPLTPAKACCQFPGKKCPAETAPNQVLKGIAGLDLTVERSFQYRFESTANKAVVEAVGDLDCDGKTVTYRREVERRDDGNIHITVKDPPDGSD